jgi:hypothetical protein
MSSYRLNVAKLFNVSPNQRTLANNYTQTSKREEVETELPAHL